MQEENKAVNLLLDEFDIQPNLRFICQSTSGNSRQCIQIREFHPREHNLHQELVDLNHSAQMKK